MDIVISFLQSILSLLLTKWVPEIYILCVNNKFYYKTTTRTTERFIDSHAVNQLSANVGPVDVCAQALLVQRDRALPTTVVRGLCSLTSCRREKALPAHSSLGEHSLQRVGLQWPSWKPRQLWSSVCPCIPNQVGGQVLQEIEEGWPLLRVEGVALVLRHNICVMCCNHHPVEKDSAPPLLRPVVQRVVADGLVQQVHSPHVLLIILQHLGHWHLCPGLLPASQHCALFSRVVEVWHHHHWLCVHPDGVRQVVFLRSSELAMSQSHVLREECCRQPFPVRPHCATRQDATHTQVRQQGNRRVQVVHEHLQVGSKHRSQQVHTHTVCQALLLLAINLASVHLHVACVAGVWLTESPHLDPPLDRLGG